MAHTPSPWEIDRSQKYYKPCIRHNGIIVALLADTTGGLADPSNRREEDAANANVIAAAPDLLEALKIAQRAIMGPSENGLIAFNDDERFQIEAAIAKATGKPV